MNKTYTEEEIVQLYNEWRNGTYGWTFAESIKYKAKYAEGVAKAEKFNKLKALNNLSLDLMEDLDSTEEEAYKLARELKEEYKEEELTKDEIHSISAAYCSVMDVYRRADG